jgi:hypothetical protein
MMQRLETFFVNRSVLNIHGAPCIHVYLDDEFYACSKARTSSVVVLSEHVINKKLVIVDCHVLSPYIFHFLVTVIFSRIMTGFE